MMRFRTNKTCIARLVVKETAVDKKKIVRPDDVHAFYCELVATEHIDPDKEHFWVFMLDARNHIRFIDLVSIGLLDASLVHPRECFRKAIVASAAAVVLCHNHPSNDVSPSAEDLRITRQLVEAGRIVDIKVIDHVIVSNDKFFSLREEKLAKFGDQ